MIQATTRDINSEKAKQLNECLEVVEGDVADRTTLETAWTGAHTVFAMTTPSFGPDAVEVKYNNSKTIADVAVEECVKYIIWSTLPAVKEISGGRFTKMLPFDRETKVKHYVRGLLIKRAFT